MENISLNDLKAQAYDKIAQIEQYNHAARQVQEDLNAINLQIRKKMDEEAAKKAQENEKEKGEPKAVNP